MNNYADKAKSLKDKNIKNDRLARLHDPHILPLTDFVDAIRKETKRGNGIPYFDPLDGGVNAYCLFLFEAAGPKAVESGFISRNNPDETAKNFFEMNQQAVLRRELTISWNIVPWYIGTGHKIRAANTKDIQAGIPYLFQLLSILPNLQVIVLSGRKAQKAESYLKDKGYSIIRMPHPSPLVINTSPKNKALILRTLQEVAERLSNQCNKIISQRTTSPSP